MLKHAKTWNPRLHAWQLKCTIFEDLDFWVICPRCDRHRLAHFPSFPTPPHHNRRKIIRLSNLFPENTILIYPLPNSRRPLHIKTGRKLSKSPEFILPLRQVKISIQIKKISPPPLKIQFLVILDAEAGRYQLNSAYLCCMCYFIESK